MLMLLTDFTFKKFYIKSQNIKYEIFQNIYRINYWQSSGLTTPAVLKRT